MGPVTRAKEHLVVSSSLFPHGKSQQSESGIISVVFWESLGWKHVSQLAGMPYLWGHLRLSLLTKKGIKWDLRTCRTSWQRVPNARMSRRWLFGSSKNKGLPTPISRHMQKCIYTYMWCGAKIQIQAISVISEVSKGLAADFSGTEIGVSLWKFFTPWLSGMSKEFANDFSSPSIQFTYFFFPGLAQGDDCSAIKKSRLFAIGVACSSSLSIHQTVLLIKINTNPVVVNGGAGWYCSLWM